MQDGTAKCSSRGYALSPEHSKNINFLGPIMKSNVTRLEVTTISPIPSSLHFFHLPLTFSDSVCPQFITTC